MCRRRISEMKKSEYGWKTDHKGRGTRPNAMCGWLVGGGENCNPLTNDRSVGGWPGVGVGLGWREAHGSGACGAICTAATHKAHRRGLRFGHLGKTSPTLKYFGRALAPRAHMRSGEAPQAGCSLGLSDVAVDVVVGTVFC